MRLKIAESFQKVLEGMESSIAKYLLEDHEFTDFANYLAIRSKNEETFISYLPKGKELEYNEEGQWSRKNRQTGKPGKIARKLIGEGVFNDHDYEIFYNEISGKTIQKISSSFFLANLKILSSLIWRTITCTQIKAIWDTLA